MADGIALQVQASEFTTRDVQQAHEIIRSADGVNRHCVIGGVDDFRFQRRELTLGELGMEAIRHTATVEMMTDPLSHLVFVVSLSAEFDIQAGDMQLRSLRGDPVLYPMGVPMAVRFADLKQCMLRLPVDRVAQVAARSGVALADFRFEGMAPVSPQARRRWRNTMRYLFKTLSAPDTALANPLVHAAAIDLAATVAIAAFPNTATAAGEFAEPGRVAPAALRRAVAFIDAHAHEPVTLEDIADAAGISARGLQAAFHRHIDTTPMAYLRRVRLERAHRDLQAADPTRGDTVADVARRWGFTSLSRFAADYRQEYGRTPRQTLRT
ncbi:AraC family transcriptional regulator [Catellatospora tritici]|uniref:AraC family transcriptional regulator n=1 Tax=Catellatospora tritici TaxID=2851566 RepID=UPI001C2DB562|nr:AraC family transcriptional regulator [Catellatospora tritici]MBV1850029.1 AraC family transcriptional regulator [Catellatospora tritici]